MNSFFSFRTLLLTAALFIISAGAGMAQDSGKGTTAVFPLIEDFESGENLPEGWATFNVDGSLPEWIIAEGISHKIDDMYAAFHSYGMGDEDGWLVTPQISIPASGPAVLSFWSLLADPEYYIKSSVLVSTTSNDPATGNFSQIWEPSEFPDEWAQIVLNLNDYAGQNIYVAFRYEGNYAHIWAIDEVEISGDFNTDPKIEVSPAVVNAIGPINSTINKNLKVKNTGVDNLIYNLSITYTGSATGWLSLNAASGNVNGGASQTHQLSFNPSGLELGDYTATLAISSNDPATPTLSVPVNYSIIGPANVGIDIMVNEYTFPYDISENGKYVVISGFGNGGMLWAKDSGLHSIDGEEITVIAVSETGIVGGDATNTSLGTHMAGTWDYQTGEWNFLGINSAVGNPSGTDYNSCWGMTADGQTLVGMQYYPNYDYKAFKWTQAGGYEMIGNIIPESNRPNGISNDGSVVFGWADFPSASRSPVIWYNNQLIKIAPNNYGEASASSSDGHYVTGNIEGKGFLWNKQDGTTTIFENTLNSGDLSTLGVMEDGTIIGYTVEGWPPFPDSRRAFVRLIDGEMMSFNEYAISRGMFDADDWLFFSVNSVTPDGNKFIGAAINPDGQAVSFLLDFNAEIPSIVVNPLSLDFVLEAGETQNSNITIQNTGSGTLNYNTVVHYQQASSLSNTNLKPVAPMNTREDFRKGTAGFQSKGKHQTQPRHIRPSENPMPALQPAQNPFTSWEKPMIAVNEKPAAQNLAGKGNYLLHYDGDNVDAIGLNSGGSFFIASRFPQAIVAPYIGATLTQVQVYIHDMPAAATLYVWGQGTTGTPGSELVQQTLTVTPYGWNTIDLTNPIALDGSDLWVGFGYTNTAGTYVAGVDGGPVNANGDFLREASSDWERLSDYGFNSNWNIRANLLLGGGNWLTLNPVSGSVEAGQSQNIVANVNGNLPVGEYHANIIIQSNDLTHPQVVIPVTLGILVGMNENSSNTLSIYPIPANQNIHINSEVEMVSVSIFDSRGQKIMEQSMHQNLSVNLPIGQLPAGIYHLRITDITNKMHTKILVKQ